MNQVYSIAPGLPFCQKTQGKQTNLSIGLRITAVVFGAIAAIVGMLILLHIPGLSQFGNVIGWTAVSVGAFLALMGASIKCIKNQPLQSNSQSIIDPEVETSTTKVDAASTVTSQKVMAKEQNDAIALAEKVIENANLPGLFEKLPSTEGMAKSSSVTEEPIKSNPTEKQKKSSALHKIVKKQAPKEFRSRLPEWLSSYLDNIPYLQLQDAPVKFIDLKDIVEPITLFSAGSTVGIHMRLCVKHVSKDPSYDRTKERPEYEQVDMKISSKDPFVLQIVAWPPALNDDLWILTSERYPCIEHRNAPLSIDHVLGDNYFRCRRDDPLEQETIEQFHATERQDELPPQYRQHLGWILLRLFKEGHIEVRERRTDRLFHSFNDPAVGYWQISNEKIVTKW